MQLEMQTLKKTKMMTHKSPMLIQPPWHVGGNLRVGCHFNKNTRYTMAQTGDMWKIDHQFHPIRHGPIGYTANNQKRPSRLYFFSDRNKELKGRGGSKQREKDCRRFSSNKKKTIKVIKNVIYEAESGMQTSGHSISHS